MKSSPSIVVLCGLSVVSGAHVSQYSFHPKSTNANPEEYIFTLGGTENMGSSEVSNGNVNPEVSLPWGFNGWSPQTALGSSWWFDSESHNLYGIRCTKQPSPWIGDYGNFRIMAHLIDPNHQSVDTFAPYNPKQTDWSAYHFQTNLLSYGTTTGYTSIEVTPTMHGSLIRAKFPPQAEGITDYGFNQTRRLMFAFEKDSGSNEVTFTNDADNNQIVVEGYSTANSGGVPSDFKHYFYATIKTENNTALDIISLAVRTDDDTLWGFADLNQADANADTVIVRIATSLISADQAKFNHASEVDQVDFDDAVTNAKSLWNQEMSRVKVNDVGDGYSNDQAVDKLTVFYSTLFRASKYPRVMWETDPDSGDDIHWSAYTGEVLPGRMSSDQGFWDAYRTTYSLLALWRPAQMAVMMDGWLNAWREGGWVPQWSSPGYRGSMTGTMSDVSMSEAIVKLPNCGSEEADEKGYCVDAPTLLEASLQNAFQVPGINSNSEGRECLEEYITLGYVAQDGGCDAVVSRTLNYLHADWALAQACTFLGDVDNAAILSARASNWTLLLNPDTGFLSPKYLDGSFNEDLFDEFGWGDSFGYTESGPWQYRLEVPYDPTSLQQALADVDIDAASVVEQANNMNSYFHAAGYGNVIHEQTEMAVNCWGQWALNNQPVFALQAMQVAFDDSVMGEKAGRAQKWLRQSLDLFTPTTDMYPGDEDNGSMGAWYVLNSLGLYPISPASGDYVIGSPQFANVTITIGGEESITSGMKEKTSHEKFKKRKDIDSSTTTALIISASNQGPENVYVQSVTWNGEAVEGVSVSYASMMQGGELHFEMGPTPATPSSL